MVFHQYETVDFMNQTGQENGFCEKRLKESARQRLNSLAMDHEGGSFADLLAAKDGLCPAAVLVPIIYRGGEPHILLTTRADDHPHHAGQISFPGGKIAPDDGSIKTAALRETLEETGIGANYIEVLGYLDPHKTGTGFAIYPVVGLLQPGFLLKPCEREVAEIFEVPLSFLMNSDNYRIESLFWRGRNREFYMLDYGSRQIWGATAAILKMLQERLYKTT